MHFLTNTLLNSFVFFSLNTAIVQSTSMVKPVPCVLPLYQSTCVHYDILEGKREEEQGKV